MSVSALHLLNGGLYPDLHRPQPVQTALLDPEQGPQISALINEELFVGGPAPDLRRGLRRRRRQRGHLAGDQPRGRRADRPPADPLHRGPPRARRALDRGARGRRTCRSRFIWGMLDPVSGAHMAERIRERLPQAPFAALEDVAHWPPLEAPRSGRGGAARRLSRGRTGGAPFPRRPACDLAARSPRTALIRAAGSPGRSESSPRIRPLPSRPVFRGDPDLQRFAEFGGERRVLVFRRPGDFRAFGADFVAVEPLEGVGRSARVPSHAPSVAVAGIPATGAATISGAIVFFGGTPVTVAVGADSAATEPARFFAITFTRSLCPTSSGTTV